MTQKVTAKIKHSSPLQDARLCDHLWNLSTLKAVEPLGKFVLLVVTREIKKEGVSMHPPTLDQYIYRVKRLKKCSIFKPVNADYS